MSVYLIVLLMSPRMRGNEEHAEWNLLKTSIVPYPEISV